MRKFLRLQRRNRSENNEIKYNKYEGRKLKSSLRMINTTIDKNMKKNPVYYANKSKRK